MRFPTSYLQHLPSTSTPFPFNFFWNLEQLDSTLHCILPSKSFQYFICIFFFWHTNIPSSNRCIFKPREYFVLPKWDISNSPIMGFLNSLIKLSPFPSNIKSSTKTNHHWFTSMLCLGKESLFTLALYKAFFDKIWFNSTEPWSRCLL